MFTSTQLHHGFAYRRRHEQAALYGSEQREAAGQQLNLQSSTEKAATAAPVQDGHMTGRKSKESPDVIRDAVKQKTQHSMASNATHVHSSDQAAAKPQLGAGSHSRPESEVASVQQIQQQKGSSVQGNVEKQGAGNSSKDIIMLDAEADDNNAACKRADPSGPAAAPTGQFAPCSSVCCCSGRPHDNMPACGHCFHVLLSNSSCF